MRFALFPLCLLVAVTTAAAADLASQIGESWYGLYLNGQKVGYLRSAVSEGESGSATVVEEAAFKLTMGGQKQDMNMYTERTYAADGRLERIHSSVHDMSGENRFEAVVKGETLYLTATMAGQSVSQELPAPQESLDDALKLAELVSGDPGIGDTVTFSAFEPIYQTELKGRSEIVAEETRVLDGVSARVYRVHTRLEPIGMESESVIAGDGTVLEDTIAGILTMRLEPEAVATDISYTNDTIISNAAKLETRIADARTRDELRLRITGPLRAEYVISDAGQQLTPNNGHWEFLGRRSGMNTISAVQIPVTEGHAAQWTEPSAFVQSDNPKLRETAQRIIGDEKDAMAVTRKLCEWVYNNVESTFSARLTNSLEVLNTLEGDCTEHTMLFIGLARAVGLPAREVAGLIYVSHPDPGFYFHQWAMVWVGEWVEVDPTFNQPLADATHIKLSEGDLLEQMKIIPLVGQLQIQEM